MKGWSPSRVIIRPWIAPTTIMIATTSTTLQPTAIG